MAAAVEAYQSALAAAQRNLARSCDEQGHPYAQGEFERDKNAAAAAYAAAEAACDAALTAEVGAADVQYAWTLYGVESLAAVLPLGGAATPA